MTNEQHKKLAETWREIARNTGLKRGTQKHALAEASYWSGVENALRLKGDSLGPAFEITHPVGRSYTDLILKD